MNNTASLGLLTTILLVGLLLIGATAASVLVNTPGEETEQDLEKITKEVTNEITTYIQIKDTVRKYYKIDGEQKIQKIAILIKPLVSIDIDITALTIKICNGEQIKILSYSGQTAFIKSYPLFEHQIWEETDHESYSLIATHDKDESTVKYNILNDYTDMAYITIKLSEQFAMEKGDTITITLFPSPGTTRTITFTAPLPIKSIVTSD